MNKNIKDLAKIFKALSDENRLKILSSVYTKECKCNEGKFSCRNETCIKELVNAGPIVTKKRREVGILQDKPRNILKNP